MEQKDPFLEAFKAGLNTCPRPNGIVQDYEFRLVHGRPLSLSEVPDHCEFRVFFTPKPTGLPTVFKVGLRWDGARIHGDVVDISPHKTRTTEKNLSEFLGRESPTSWVSDTAISGFLEIVTSRKPVESK